MRASLAKHGRDHRLQGHDPLPNAQERVADGGTTNPFASGVNGDLLWNHAAGDTLFDFSDSSKPLVLSAGVYAAVMIAGTNAAFASGYWTLDVRFGEAGTAPIMFFDSVDVGPNPNPSGVSVARIAMPAWTLPRGAECNVHVTNNTGGPIGFTLLSSYIQRIY